MIFRQFFDAESSTFTYLIASRPGAEALIVDPVLGKVDRYLKIFEELDLRLVKAVDTHCHADHVTALGALRDATRCVTVMGEKTQVDVVSMRVADGDRIEVENVSLDVMYTPGHTDDSYSFLMNDRVFTGDTLLIRGTGRTDFQNGSNEDAYDSLFNKLLKLPDETLIYPAHDYKGDTVSTIGEERAFNPRLQVSSAAEYAEIMNNLNLPDPKMMDEAIPANLRIGFKPDDPAVLAATRDAADVLSGRHGPESLLMVDLREPSERKRDGEIPGALHLPYGQLRESIAAGGLLRAMAKDSERPVLLFCAYGERSALALAEMLEAGFDNAAHLAGGLEAWKKAGGPLA